MNGNKHLTWTVFTFILSGVIGFSYLIFKMGSVNVAAQIQDLKDADKSVLIQYREISDQLNEIKLDIVAIKSKLGIRFETSANPPR